MDIDALKRRAGVTVLTEAEQADELQRAIKQLHSFGLDIKTLSAYVIGAMGLRRHPNVARALDVIDKYSPEEIQSTTDDVYSSGWNAMDSENKSGIDNPTDSNYMK